MWYGAYLQALRAKQSTLALLKASEGETVDEAPPVGEASPDVRAWWTPCCPKD
jgi:hypothetical protein